MIRLAIEWSNAAHFLLQQPDATVEVLDGPGAQNPRVLQWPFHTSVSSQVLPKTVAANNRWVFDVPSGAAWLSVDFSFNYSYGGTSYRLSRVLQLLSVSQGLAVRWFPTITDAATQDAATRALQRAGSMQGALSAATDRQHPLVKSRISSEEFTLSVATEFVDVTDLWDAMHGQTDNAKIYKQYGRPENTLLVLAYTGGTPLLWFAVIPESVKQSGGTVRAHVFFRPLGSTPLSDVPPNNIAGLTLPNQQSVGGDPTKRDFQYNIAWSTLNRYILGPTTRFWLLSQMILGCFPHEGDYALNAGLEDSLFNSRQPVILFLPLTSVARGYGDASTNRLPALLPPAMALIRSRINVLRYDQRYELATAFGISGFSQGGNDVFSVLTKNSGGPIDSVFLFQPNSLDTIFADPLARLAATARKLTVCVVTQGLASSAVQQLKSRVEAAGRGRLVKVVLMPDPSKTNFYHLFPTIGQNDWIRYLFRQFLAPQTPSAAAKKTCPMAGHPFTDDEMKADLSSPGTTGTKWTDFLHQFVMIGGQVFPYKPETYDETPLKKTFFQECLEQSA